MTKGGIYKFRDEIYNYLKLINKCLQLVRNQLVKVGRLRELGPRLYFLNTKFFIHLQISKLNLEISKLNLQLFTFILQLFTFGPEWIDRCQRLRT